MQGVRVLAKSVNVGTMFKLDAIWCNSFSIFVPKRCVEYRPLESKHVTTFDVWIPRKELSLQKQVTYREDNVVPSNSGHIGEKGLWVLKQKNCVYGLNGCSLEFFCY